MPTKQELASSGFTLEDYEEDVDVWLENWPAVQFFGSLGRGAWQQGMSGPSGLRYEALPFQFLMRGIKKRDWPAMYDDLLVLELAALKAMHSEE